MLRSLKLYAPFAAALALTGCNAGARAYRRRSINRPRKRIRSPVAGAEPRASRLSGSRAWRSAVRAADFKPEPSA